MTITVVNSGVAKAAAAYSSPLTVSFGATQSGDVVYLVGRELASATGYTDIAGTNAWCKVLRKVLGSGETSASAQATSDNAGVVVAYYVLRGVDTTTPEDGVSPVQNSTIGNPSAITPATNNSAVLAVSTLEGLDTASAAPSGYTNLQSDQQAGSMFENSMCAAIKIGTTGGVSEDPGAFSSFSNGTSGVSFTIAIRALNETNLALTGQSVTSSAGSIASVSSYGLTGQALTLSQGTLTPYSFFGAALVGQALAAAQGTLSPVMSVGLSGAAAAVAQGTLVNTATYGVSGQQLGTAQGAVSVTVTVALTGHGATMGQGSLAPVEFGVYKPFRVLGGFG